jgi:hypothetical protein
MGYYYEPAWILIHVGAVSPPIDEMTQISVFLVMNDITKIRGVYI